MKTKSCCNTPVQNEEQSSRRKLCGKKRSRFASILVLSCASLIHALLPTVAIAGSSCEECEDKRKPRILHGRLGQLDPFSDAPLTKEEEEAFASQAKRVLGNIARTRLEGSGDEEFELVPGRNVTKDEQGQIHLKFKQKIRGIEVDGASVFLHVDRNGEVFGMNGEFVDVFNTQGENGTLSCEESFNVALEQKPIKDGVWIDSCTETYVYTKDGTVYKAWKRTIDYTETDLYNTNQTIYHKDILFASMETGDLVAVQPLATAAVSMNTRNCFNQNNLAACPTTLATNGPVGPSADAVQTNTHNNVYNAYKYYLDRFKRNSIDGRGGSINVFVHFDSYYNNAFWDGTNLVFGDGDGYYFGPLGNALDIVSHEYTHGVTQYESGLLYYGDSGAINEAMSDIMGEAIQWYYGVPSVDRFRIGEAAWTPNVAGDSLRYMDDPALADLNHDFYPTRYRGFEDSGGVHWNSGIANLAFSLMVKGGSHPRGKTPGIGAVSPLSFDIASSMNIAAGIFYHANVDCLTRYADFNDLKYCTALHAGDKYRGTVLAAWDAVGVPGLRWNELVNSVPLISKVPFGFSGKNGHEYWFYLDGIRTGERVACSTEGQSGSLSLRVLFASTAPDRNECASSKRKKTPNESCTTAPFTGSSTRAYVVVKAKKGWARKGSPVELTCSGTFKAAPRELPSGITATGLSSPAGGYLTYRLKGGVRPNDVISATVKGGNGNADLFLHTGSIRKMPSCKSTTGTSKACTTKQASEKAGLYIQIYSPSGYSDLALHTCKQAPSKCMKASDCCSGLTCDGTKKKNRICKTCRKKGQSCMRTTECCGDKLCIGGKCKTT